jgi:hypothetical protein
VCTDDGPSGSQFIALRTRVSVEVVRPRSTPAKGPSRRYSAGPVRNFAVGGRDLLAELNTWLSALPNNMAQQLENESEAQVRPAEPIRAVMPPPLAQTIDDRRQSWAAASSEHTLRDPISGRALSALSAPLTA